MAPRTFVLMRDGVAVNELTTTIHKKRKTFEFPYTTSDPREIKYLLSRGAAEKARPARLYGPSATKTDSQKGGGE